MMERAGGVIWFHCEMCPDAIDTEEQDFTEAWAAAKAAGWRARSIGDGWAHICPDCVEGG